MHSYQSSREERKDELFLSLIITKSQQELVYRKVYMQFLKFSLLILLPYSWQEELKTQRKCVTKLQSLIQFL